MGVAFSAAWCAASGIVWMWDGWAGERARTKAVAGSNNRPHNRKSSKAEDEKNDRGPARCIVILPHQGMRQREREMGTERESRKEGRWGY